MKEMKDISNIIKIDLLEIDYTLSYFENKHYLFILFIWIAMLSHNSKKFEGSEFRYSKNSLNMNSLSCEFSIR